MSALKFARWELQPDLSLSALLPGGMSLCGIYVLEFADGEEYVGQSVALLNRLSDHRRHWPDEIVAVRFAPVPAGELAVTERDVIAHLVATGIRLRNVNLVTFPLRSDALDLVVDRMVQEEWLNGNIEPLQIGERGRIAEQRRRTEPRYRKLTLDSDYSAIVGALAAYVRKCLPWPHETEGRFWALTSLPCTGRSPEWHRLSALSVNNVEVLVLGEACDAGGEWGCGGFMNVALEPTLKAVRHAEIDRGEYASVGEVQRIWFDDFDTLAKILADDQVATAARRLAMGLLRKGRGMFARFHDYNLADDVFRELAKHAG